jgi:hypothetical protein
VPGINDAVRISRGARVCTDLHNGMTPRQEVDANPIVYFDLRGVDRCRTARTLPGRMQGRRAYPPATFSERLRRAAHPPVHHSAKITNAGWNSNLMPRSRSESSPKAFA